MSVEEECRRRKVIALSHTLVDLARVKVGADPVAVAEQAVEWAREARQAEWAQLTLEAGLLREPSVTTQRHVVEHLVELAILRHAMRPEWPCMCGARPGEPCGPGAHNDKGTKA